MGFLLSRNEEEGCTTELEEIRRKNVGYVEGRRDRQRGVEGVKQVCVL